MNMSVMHTGGHPNQFMFNQNHQIKPLLTGPAGSYQTQQPVIPPVNNMMGNLSAPSSVQKQDMGLNFEKQRKFLSLSLENTL
jgi:hypothetical protein